MRHPNQGAASKLAKRRPPNTAPVNGGVKTGPPWERVSAVLSVGDFGGPAAVIWLSGVPWCAVIPKWGG